MHVEKVVLIRGRLDRLRKKGGRLVFAVLRQRAETVQIVFQSGTSEGQINSKAIAWISKVRPESVVDIEGRVVPVSASAGIVSCTQHAVEISGQSMVVYSRAPAQLPLLVQDASVPEPLLEAQRAGSAPPQYVDVDLSTRLDHRIIDLRTAANQGIFRFRAALVGLFRAYLDRHGFTEISSPKMVAEASEGGASVFQLKYFEREAYLAQSPQLYKQMAIASDFDRVYEIGPVFRAEKSDTPRHMTEFTGLDFEMQIHTDYYEVLELVLGLFCEVFERLEQVCDKELAAIRRQYPSEPPRLPKQGADVSALPIVNFAEAAQMIGLGADANDFTVAEERAMGRILGERFDSDLVLVDQFPASGRPFYSMPSPNVQGAVNAYDLYLRGEEICSGAQRVHDVDLLEKKIRELGIGAAGLKNYLDAFRAGMPPHGGAGIGLDRIVMLYLNLQNIRKAALFPRDPYRLTP